MTCIVGLETKKGIYIGGDKLGSNRMTGQSYRRPKVFKKDDFIFGVCGSYREMQLLEFHLEIPKRHIDEDVDKYLYIKLVDAVFKLFEKHKVLDKENMFYGEFLFGYEGKLYRLQCDFGLLEPACGYTTTGSGTYHSEAAMSIFESDEFNHLTPEDKIKKAIIVASEKVLSVNDEVDIVFLPNKKRK